MLAQKEQHHQMEKANGFETSLLEMTRRASVWRTESSGPTERWMSSVDVDGVVVVGWLGRASTILHCTHHVTHVGSRDTSVSFSFLPFSIFVSLE